MKMRRQDNSTSFPKNSIKHMSNISNETIFRMNLTNFFAHFDYATHQISFHVFKFIDENFCDH